MLHLPIFAALFSMLNQFYQGHLNLAQFGEQAQSRFANARVLCVGAGGLACHLLPLLATAGIGRITLIDGDLIVTSNLQRQTLFTLADRGQYKARVAALRLRQLNPESEIDALCCPFSAANAEALFTQHDVILDCADNATTTYLINHTALIKKRPWVHGSVEQIAGQCALFTPDTPCYACLFSENEMPAAQSCSARGVFSPAVAMVASYQAALLLRYLAAEECLAEAGLFFSLTLVPPRLTHFVLPKARCKLCTEIPPLVADVTAPCDVLSVQQLTEWRAQPNALLVDVRSVTAHRQHNLNALSVPFNETWHGFVPDALTSHKHTPVCLVCDRGRTSELAARCLLTAGFSQVSHLAGGMVEWRLVHEKTHIPQPSVHNACQNDT